MLQNKQTENFNLAVNFGDNLRRLMSENHLSIKELSQEADIVYNQLSGYTRGDHLPTPEVLKRLCKALSCSIDQLLPLHSGMVCNTVADEAEGDYQAMQVVDEKSGKKANVLEMAKSFGIRSVKLHQYLMSQTTLVDSVLVNNLHDNDCQIGSVLIKANNDFFHDKNQFYNGISIAINYCKQTEYWLGLLSEGNYISKEMYASLYKDLKSIINVLFAIIRKRNEDKKVQHK